jgi:glyoxylase-like metal-dependent hydrolase (beta-lactamase superfamily II)
MPRGPIDLRHLGGERQLAAYLVETDDGLALFDCGPTSCLDALRAGLAENGFEVTDLRHLLLSHIHLDHAGAAGELVRANPRLVVHVSAIGAPHLLDPSRLEASARRLYGDQFDTLWGALTPIPAENLRVVESEVVGLECFETRGHAEHHVSYLHSDGTLYAGDAAGVRITPNSFVFAPTTPPEIDLPKWEATIAEIERRSPSRLAVIHFGVFDDVATHLERLRATMRRWAQWVADGADEDAFVGLAQSDLRAAGPAAAIYEHAAPLTYNYAGLERYWRKAREAGGSD